MILLNYIVDIVAEKSFILGKNDCPKELMKVGQNFTKYAVNTECQLASKLGTKVLERGGNAIDAMVAATTATGIVNSFSAGIGGGGFALIKINGEYKYFDFRETAPLKVDIKHYIKHPKDLQISLKSSCVPGEIKGLYMIHRQYGKLAWADVLSDCIKLCEEGFEANILLVNKLIKNKDDILSDEGFKQIYTRNGEFIKEGDLVKRENLGRTLRKISEDPESFYTGEIADKIVEFSNKNGGLFTKEDFTNYTVKDRPVITGKFKEYNVTTTSFPTSGPFVLLALHVLNNFDLKSIKKELTKSNEYYIFHFLIETFKFMFYKRGEVEDPDFMINPAQKIREYISDDLAKTIFLNIKVDKPIKREMFDDTKAFSEDHGTTHLNIIDKEQNLALVTSTINLEFGSKVMDPETGIIFNNHMDDFTINIDSDQNIGGINSIEPGKRPFSSASPVILEKDNKALLLIGAAGGIKIPTSVVSTILLFYLTDDLQKSIAHPRIHDQLLPKTTFVEGTFPLRLQNQLMELGHEIIYCDLFTKFTSVNAIYVESENGSCKIQAVADPRKLGNSCGK